jgi:hypothetical protein
MSAGLPIYRTIEASLPAEGQRDRRKFMAVFKKQGVYWIDYYQTLRSSSQPLQAWECMRASLETELSLEFVKAEVSIVPLPLQHTKRDQAAREMMPLRPFRTGLTAG